MINLKHQTRKQLGVRIDFKLILPAVEGDDPVAARVHESVPGPQLLWAPPAELDVRGQVAPVVHTLYYKINTINASYVSTIFWSFRKERLESRAGQKSYTELKVRRNMYCLQSNTKFDMQNVALLQRMTSESDIDNWRN